VKITLFVEGPSDRDTLSILVKRILGEQISIIPKVGRGKGDLLNERKVSTQIRHIIRKHPDISKIIVCVDSDCTSADETEKEIKKVETAIKAGIQQKYPIYYVGVVHALEGWLLADPESIKEYLGPRARVNIHSSSTLKCKPKELMRDIFRKSGKEFLPMRDNPRIAEKVDINRIAKNNESFTCFWKRVKDT